jgi:hypothetical protein
MPTWGINGFFYALGKHAPETHEKLDTGKI